ncbi:MAG: hypothetical protein IPK48_01460 [Gammaproteobacteria bacterium]|nr:hypothetical protein [Gammaproteobacteria bacterium]
MVDIREEIPFNEREDSRRHREAITRYIQHSQAEQKARVEGDARYLERQIVLVENAMREHGASAKTGGGK